MCCPRHVPVLLSGTILRQQLATNTVGSLRKPVVCLFESYTLDGTVPDSNCQEASVHGLAYCAGHTLMYMAEFGTSPPLRVDVMNSGRLQNNLQRWENRVWAQQNRRPDDASGEPAAGDEPVPPSHSLV